MPPTPVMHSTHRIDDDYWRFNKYDQMRPEDLRTLLMDAKYYCMSSWPRYEMLKVAYRKETSRPDYKRFGRTELHKFAVGRKIMEEQSKKPSKAKLRDLLYAADTSPVFHKLQELPAEIRVRIYEFSFCDFPESFHRPSQPPLARLSKMMREEVLAHFYKTCRFEIRYLYRMPALGKTRGTLAMDPESLLFLYNLRAKDVLILRNLRLVFNFYSGQVFNFKPVIQHWVSIDATLASETAEATTMTQFGGKMLPLLPDLVHTWQSMPQPVKDCQGQLLVDVENVIREVLGSVEPYQLQMSDLWKLVGKVEGVLRATAERIKWW